MPRTDWPKIRDHWLAVDVFSRSSKIYDRDFKRDAYFALGVQQVWLVDWRQEEVEVCTAPGQWHHERDRIEWRAPADIVVTIELSEVFAGF